MWLNDQTSAISQDRSGRPILLEEHLQVFLQLIFARNVNICQVHVVQGLLSLALHDLNA